MAGGLAYEATEAGAVSNAANSREPSMKSRSRAVEEAADRAARMGIAPEHLIDFEAARKRRLERRMGMCFKTYKPVVDDAPHRAFDSTAEYRRWCNENLPMWLGYRSPAPEGDDRGSKSSRGPRPARSPDRNATDERQLPPQEEAGDDPGKPR